MQEKSLENGKENSKLPRGIITAVAKKAKVTPSSVTQSYQNGNIEYIKLINIELKKILSIQNMHKILLEKVSNGTK